MEFGIDSIKNSSYFGNFVVPLLHDTNGKVPAMRLDWQALLKASRAMSSEVVFDRLLPRLMSIVMESAGAERGLLILPRQDEWVVEVEGWLDEAQVHTFTLSLWLSEAVERLLLPIEIINQVARTQEPLLLNEALNLSYQPNGAKKDAFRQDQYIVAKQPQSIFCLPLINQAKLVGIFYLEHRLMTGIFSADRLQILNVLAAQAAISLENAMAYQRVQEQAIEYRESLSQMQLEMNIAQQQLVESEKMAALGGLVASVAHEINTPVGVCLTAASYLEQKTNAFGDLYRKGRMKRSDLERYLQMAGQSSAMILTNINRATDLIQSFKQVAVDQSSQEQRTFPVKAYLQDVLRSLEPKLKQTSHTIQIHGDKSLTLNSYPGAFSQILTNFVMNSLLHAYEPKQAGKLLVELLVKVKEERDQLILTYSDDGRGIQKGDLSQIFDPFFTTKRGQGGSGLGLHIIYNLVTQKLGGTIRCESEIGNGTTFIIEIPIARDGHA